MRKLLFVLIGILLIASCKKCPDVIDCEEPNCPLTTGEYCSNNMINLNDQCVCPDSLVEFNNNCIDFNNDIFYSSQELIVMVSHSCACVDDYNTLWCFNIENGDINLYEIPSVNSGPNISDGPLNFDAQIDGPPTPDNFYAHLYPLGCDGNPLYMHGSIVGDTLCYDLFIYNTTDTCKGFKVLDARL